MIEHLDEITVEDLQRALDEVEGKRSTQRLLAAIAYKNGVSQTELAEWYGVQRRTIYSWLKRFEREPLKQAVRDDHRSGRPRKLGERRQTQLEETLHEPPTNVGYDAPALVRRSLVETFDVTYSRPSCRRLMREGGLSYRKPRRAAADTGAEGHEELEGSAGRWIPR